jgi:hypothetical protein
LSKSGRNSKSPNIEYLRKRFCKTLIKQVSVQSDSGRISEEGVREAMCALGELDDCEGVDQIRSGLVCVRAVMDRDRVVIIDTKSFFLKFLSACLLISICLSRDARAPSSMKKVTLGQDV